MSLETIRQAYEEASRTWTGCDWQTRHGKKRLNLEACTSSQAAAQAGQAQESEAREWHIAADWLAEIELQAAEAQQEGDEALEAARSGDLYDALRHAQRACWLEQRSGRTNERSPAWPRLCHAISEAVKDFEEHLEAGVSTPAGVPESLPDYLLREELARQRQYLHSFQSQIKRLATRLERLESELRREAKTP